ncbi:hypothetical protein [Salinispira pacifica]|nr:hypothetical protein [Salinispira pacifica]
MDQAFIRKYEAAYGTSELKLDSYLIHRMGLKKRHTFIKLKDFFLYAVPVKIGFTSGKILLSMSEREIALLESMKESPQQLRMRFVSPRFSHEIGLFLKILIKQIHSGNGAGNAVLVDLKILSPSDDFKTILIDLFQLYEELEQAWEARKESRTGIPTRLLQQAEISSALHLIIPGSGRYRCLVKEIGLTTCSLYISKSLAPALNNGIEQLSLEVVWSQGSFLVQAAITGTIQDTHQEGVKLLTAELQFSPALTDLLLPMIRMIEERTGDPPREDGGENGDSQSYNAQGGDSQGGDTEEAEIT